MKLKCSYCGETNRIRVKIIKRGPNSSTIRTSKRPICKRCGKHLIQDILDAIPEKKEVNISI